MIKLFNQIIESKLSLSDELFATRKYFRWIWQFYCVYNISCAIIDFKEDENLTKERDYVWFQWVKKGTFYSKYCEYFQKRINKDRNIVIQALKYLNNQSSSNENVLGDIYKKGAIGILSFELEN